jgi:hypothetical protein
VGGQQAPSRGFKGGSGNLELICLCLPYPTPRRSSISCTCLWEEQRECWRGSCRQPAVSSAWRALLVACRPEPVRSGSKRSQQQHPQHCLPAFSCSIRLNLIHARSLKPTCTLVIIAMMRQARYKTMAKGKATTHIRRGVAPQPLNNGTAQRAHSQLACHTLGRSSAKLTRLPMGGAAAAGGVACAA